jgi:hypothetical protein
MDSRKDDGRHARDSAPCRCLRQMRRGFDVASPPAEAGLDVGDAERAVTLEERGAKASVCDTGWDHVRQSMFARHVGGVRPGNSA